MDELERYLARRRRRQQFAITIRDSADPARWARLQFEDRPLVAVLEPGAIRMVSLPDDPDPKLRPHLGLVVHGHLDDRSADRVDFTRLADLIASGLVDFGDRMEAAGWTDPQGFSDRGNEYYRFRRQRPTDDKPATLAAIARDAAAALLGTDEYLLTIEPFQGVSWSVISEGAGYRGLRTMGCFVVGAPIAILISLVTRNPLEVALVAVALAAIAGLYLTQLSKKLDVEEALARLQLAFGESAFVELPIVGPLIELVLALAVALVGIWVPIVVAIVIRSVV